VWWSVARAWTDEQAQRCLWRRPKTDYSSGAKRQPGTDFQRPFDWVALAPKRDKPGLLASKRVGWWQVRCSALAADRERRPKARRPRMPPAFAMLTVGS
jgi:hypothetical protein